MIMEFICIYTLIIAFGVATCDDPFMNPLLSWKDRVDNLVDNLNLTEIMLQMAYGGEGKKAGPAPAIPRLGIGPYQWNEECLRGVDRAGRATPFPQAIGLAAAFSPSLMHEVAEAIGIEARAKHNDYVKKKQYGDHTGLSCLDPVINVMRHPLWGRNQETYGEDQHLTGVYAANYVKGLQGYHPRYVRANAGCKHFDAYAGPENLPKSRLAFDAEVSERDLRLTFLPAFRECVRAGTFNIMCSYNSLNGIPSCVNHNLLTKILRSEWGFKGYVISDEVALEFIISKHKFFNSTVETAAAAIKAGCNLELSGNNPAVYLQIEEAVRKGLVDEILVRERVKPLFYTRMRLGEFDPPSMNPYLKYNLSLVQSLRHRQLAVKAAMQSFVLLKNERLLPLTKYLDKIAIVGPMANNIEQLYGDYAADVDREFAKTPLEGLKNIAADVRYGAGCTDNKCRDYRPIDIKLAMLEIQLTIIFVGTGQELETEGKDRHSMDLPVNQTQLIKDAIAFSNGSPILLLVFSAGPVNISFADRSPGIQAIMQCFFPAQATGDALFNSLAMATKYSSPGGRLPYTWYDTADQIPSMTDYSMEGRTYRYFKGTPLYPFGYGLSYSDFKYSNLTLLTKLQAGDEQFITGFVKNIGPVDAYEVVQVYLSWRTTGERMPNIQLVGFDRVFLKANTTQKFSFTITSEQMAVWTDCGWTVQTGVYEIWVGGQQPNQMKKTGSNILNKIFYITGEMNLGKF